MKNIISITVDGVDFSFLDIGCNTDEDCEALDLVTGWLWKYDCMQIEREGHYLKWNALVQVMSEYNQGNPCAIQSIPEGLVVAPNSVEFLNLEPTRFVFDGDEYLWPEYVKELEDLYQQELEIYGPEYFGLVSEEEEEEDMEDEDVEDIAAEYATYRDDSDVEPELDDFDGWDDDTGSYYEKIVAAQDEADAYDKLYNEAFGVSA